MRDIEVSSYKCLVRTNAGYVVRIYTEGWDNNLDAWTEEVEDAFDSFVLSVGDNPLKCKLHGRAELVWLLITKNNIAHTEVFTGQSQSKFKNPIQATMIRVHRIRKRTDAN